MPNRCGHVRRDRLTFELFHAEDGLRGLCVFHSCCQGRNSRTYLTFSYSCCGGPAKAARLYFSLCMADLPSTWLLWAIRQWRRAQPEAAEGAVVRDFSGQLPPRASQPSIIIEGQLFSASHKVLGSRKGSNSVPLPPSHLVSTTYCISVCHRSVVYHSLVPVSYQYKRSAIQNSFIFIFLILHRRRMPAPANL